MSPPATQAAIRIRIASLTTARRDLLVGGRVGTGGGDGNRITTTMTTITANTAMMSHMEARRDSRRNGQDDGPVRMRTRRCPSRRIRSEVDRWTPRLLMQGPGEAGDRTVSKYRRKDTTRLYELSAEYGVSTIHDCTSGWFPLHAKSDIT